MRLGLALPFFVVFLHTSKETVGSSLSPEHTERHFSIPRFLPSMHAWKSFGMGAISRKNIEFMRRIELKLQWQYKETQLLALLHTESDKSFSSLRMAAQLCLQSVKDWAALGAPRTRENSWAISSFATIVVCLVRCEEKRALRQNAGPFYFTIEKG